jgi:hypothetical protein
MDAMNVGRAVELLSRAFSPDELERALRFSGLVDPIDLPMRAGQARRQWTAATVEVLRADGVFLEALQDLARLRRRETALLEFVASIPPPLSPSPRRRRISAFLAHAPDDNDEVEDLARRLVAAGVSPWFVKWSVESRPWSDVVEDAVHASDLHVVLIGKSGPAGLPARVRQLLQGRKRFTVLVDGASELPPETPRTRRVFDYRQRDETVFADLLTTLHSGERPPSPDLVTADPYRGLLAFRHEDARLFFGRRPDVAGLLESMRQGKRLMAVTGASGAGKSSLVRAGLGPAVWSGELDGSLEWRVATILPGADPCRALAEALVELKPGQTLVEEQVRGLAQLLEEAPDALSNSIRSRLDPGQSLLLVVDQLEELFSLTTQAKRRAAFLRSLVDAAHAPDSRLRVVATIRADFLGQALHDPTFGSVATTCFEPFIAPMTAERLEQTITAPCTIAGATIDREVVALLVRDVRNQAADLPLLQFALQELWRHSTTGHIQATEYEAMGGLHKALTAHADQVVSRFSSDQRQAAEVELIQFRGQGWTWIRRV